MLTFLRSHADKDSKDWSKTDTADYERRKRVLSEQFKKYEVKGTRQTGFYFEPKDFAVIRDALQGMSMSKEALELIKRYFKDLALAEQATNKENLVNYSMDNLGGFVKRPQKNEDESVKTDAAGNIQYQDLLIKQKQALAWLDASGNRGVCALDTGIGKTLTSIAVMQKLTRDGLLDENAGYTNEHGREVKTNGRFLFVCPATLKGNLPKEIRGFLPGPWRVGWPS